MTLDEAIKHCEEKAEELEKRLKPYQCESINKKLYEVNKKEWDSCLECAKEHRQLATWLKELKQLREQMNHSEKPNKWIPVSEGLPKENTAVLIWCPERKNTYCAYLEEGQWWIFGAHFQKVTLEVIAWMPLPEPYKAESEE